MIPRSVPMGCRSIRAIRFVATDDSTLDFGAPCQLPLLVGLEHGRTIPLADIGRIETLQRRGPIGAIRANSLPSSVGLLY
jgi:hypothetical protein